MVTRINKSKYICKKIFPIFNWKPCCFCDKEFVRETGFVAISGPFYGGIGREKYICNTCSHNSIEEANKLFIHRMNEELNHRPKAPPAPPQPRNVRGSIPIPPEPPKPPPVRIIREDVR